MGKEDREWYREWHRQKHDYTERADFRISETDRQKKANRRAWFAFVLRLAYGLLVIYGAVLFTKNHIFPLL